MNAQPLVRRRRSWRPARLAVLTVGGIGKNLVYYWGPTELHAAGDKAWAPSAWAAWWRRLVKRGTGASNVEFDVIDRPGGACHVRCTGVPPQMFRERSASWSRDDEPRGLLRRPPPDGVAQQRVPRPPATGTAEGHAHDRGARRAPQPKQP
jgi:hypothetical protein